MRISDWSSDVCSSDLRRAVRRTRCKARRADVAGVEPLVASRGRRLRAAAMVVGTGRDDNGPDRGEHHVRQPLFACPSVSRTLRSEEHTSELQSLMRISYAVFCLKKKKIIKHKKNTKYY